VNLQQANFEDLLATYYLGTAAHEAAQHLGRLARTEQHLELATLLRDYRERGIHSRTEIELRAATDRLMTCCSVMEIASLTGFVPELRQTDFAMAMLPILENKHVRRYYEDFYPTKLPQLFRHRLSGTNRVIEKSDRSDTYSRVMAFLDLDRRFMEQLDDGYLLRMLDSFRIEGYWFSDVVAVVRKPEEFISRLLLAPEERDALSRALNEFSLFMQFCFDLQRLLTLTQPQPLLQSAIWNHYSYWFDIIGMELNEQLGDALSQFLAWKPEGDDIDASNAVQTYVAEARAALETLTSRRFANPVDTLLNKLLKTQTPVDIDGIRVSEPLRVFVSYSHKDQNVRNTLETCLQPLQQQGLIDLWTDREITAGEKWERQIHDSLESADIILLLVSKEFVASDYCHDLEMIKAVERHKAGEVNVIPIILGDVDWNSAPFGKLQALPRGGRPVMLWKDRDSAWNEVAAGIREIAEQIRSR
jgi:hypothetical protein